MWISKLPGIAIRLAAIGGVVLVMAGCGHDGPPRAEVSGRITLDGEPLETGMIRFVPIDDTPGQKISMPVVHGAFGSTQKNGPIVGSYRIEIESTDTAGLAMDDEDTLERISSKARLKVVLVPGRYNTRSRLTAIVQATKSNAYTFELQAKPMQP